MEEIAPRIAHVTSVLSVAGGGIPPVALSLAATQRRLGSEAVVFGAADPHAQPLAVPGASHQVFRRVGPRALGWTPGMLRGLSSFGPDVTHLHGLFTWASRVSRAWQDRTARPLVLSPHGMLEPWALRRSAWKKRLFRAFVEDENLRRATCLHALSESEARSMRRCGLSSPIAVIPNGIDVPDLPAASGDRWRALIPNLRERRVLLFLGRIHPVKGLELLLEAWARLPSAGSRRWRQWLLVIAGPDPVGHAAVIEGRIGALGLSDSVWLTGPAYGADKLAALAAAQGFVLSSLSEAFPVAVLEAMAMRLPVVLTEACNMPAEAAGAGFVAALTADSLAAKLAGLLDLPEAAARDMGQRGRRLVEEQYSWERVAREHLAVYRWLLGRGARPPFVADG